MTWYSRCLKLHLYLGLSVGLIFVILGLTGSVIVFWQIIDRWLEPQVVAFETDCSPAAYLPTDVLIAVAQAKVPSEGQLKMVFFPNAERLEFRMVYQMPSTEYQGKFFDRYDLHVAPCTAEVKGPRLWEKLGQPLKGPVMAVIMRLHTSLLLSWPPHWFGSHFVGAIGALLLLPISSGLYLWWPRHNKLKQAFTFKFRCSVERKVFDLHKLSGVYGVVVLGVLLFTGTTMYFPWRDLLLKAVQCLSPRTASESVLISHQTKNQPSIDVGRALVIARQTTPNRHIKSLALPINENGVYVVTLDSAESVRSTRITLDRYSGAILESRSASQGTWGDIFWDWLFPLHTGEAFGIAGRIVVLIAGLLPSVLYITGFIRWKQKRRVKHARVSSNLQRTSISLND